MVTKSAYSLEIDGHALRFTNLDKVLYPAAGFTKAQVIDYYVRMAPVLLPHLRGRPLSLKRYPDGVEEPYFFQKECPAHRPDWLSTVPVRSEKSDRDVPYCGVNSVADLAWLANLANLEVHTYLALGKNLDSPTMLVFDLDPGPGCDLLTSAGVALLVRDRLEEDGLESYAKVSGNKGVHVYAPLNSGARFDATKPYSRGIAQGLQKEHPKLLTANMSKEVRQGRVFIDWSQNDRHKTTVCAYSLRGTPIPYVSAPVGWDELEDAVKGRDADRLRFTPAQAQERVELMGDLFSDVLTQKQRLPSLAA